MLSTIFRTFLKRITIILLFIILFNAGRCSYRIVHDRITAPPALPCPGPSQIGKVGSGDRGGSFSGLEVFKHYVYFPFSEQNKLNPELRESAIHTHTHASHQTKFGKWVSSSNLFNIILIISQTGPIYSLVGRSITTRQTPVETLLSHTKNTSQLGKDSRIRRSFLIVRSLRLSLNDNYVITITI
jgi:hypothetical protein